MIPYLKAVEKLTTERVTNCPTSQHKLTEFLKSNLDEGWILVLVRHERIVYFVCSYQTQEAAEKRSLEIVKENHIGKDLYTPRIFFWDGQVLSGSKLYLHGLDTDAHVQHLKQFMTRSYPVQIQFAWAESTNGSLYTIRRVEQLNGIAFYAVRLNWKEYMAYPVEYAAKVMEALAKETVELGKEENRKSEDVQLKLREAAQRQTRRLAKSGKASKIHLQEAKVAKKQAATKKQADLTSLEESYGTKITVGCKVVFALDGVTVVGTVAQHVGSGLLVKRTDTGVPLADKRMKDGLVKLSASHKGLMPHVLNSMFN